MSKETGHLATANLSRDELALWIFSGVYGVRPQAGRDQNEAIADIMVLPDGPTAWARCQRGADYVILMLASKFESGSVQ